MTKKKVTFLSFLSTLVIFSIFFDRALRGVLPFDFYYYYPVFILFLITVFFKFGRIWMTPKWFNIGASIIIGGSMIGGVIKNTLGFEFIKQVFGIYFTAIVYYNLIRIHNFDIKALFKLYLRMAEYVAIFGVIDNMLHIAGIHLTAVNQTGPFTYREYAFMGEPFFLTLALTPAIFYYIMHFKEAIKYKKVHFFFLIACYLLTYSSTAVSGLILAGVLYIHNNGYLSGRGGKVIFLPLLAVPMFLIISSLVKNVDLINARFNDSVNLFFTTDIKTEEARTANASTFALYSNYVIARDSFLENPLTGSGLGSHPLIYEATFKKYFPTEYLTAYGAQNQQDANSKFLRLMSETGLIGLVTFLAAFFRFKIPRRYYDNPLYKDLTIINHGIFIYIFLCLIRNGNYINDGFFLFFFLYYYTWKTCKQNLLSKTAANNLTSCQKQ